MIHPQNSTMREYLLALAATLVALLARAVLDPLLGDHLPYVTFFIAVAVTTSYAGPGASVTAVLMGGLAAEWSSCLRGRPLQWSASRNSSDSFSTSWSL